MLMGAEVRGPFRISPALSGHLRTGQDLFMNDRKSGAALEGRETFLNMPVFWRFSFERGAVRVFSSGRRC